MDYLTEKFNKLNRETREYNNRNVNRSNPSTQSNYGYFDPYRQGYSNCYTRTSVNNYYNHKN